MYVQYQYTLKISLLPFLDFDESFLFFVLLAWPLTSNLYLYQTEIYPQKVTFNYRCPVPFRTPEYTDNMGLKDQQLVLKWINENAEQFGSDKNRITVFFFLDGSSAGKSTVCLSVMYHDCLARF